MYVYVSQSVASRTALCHSKWYGNTLNATNLLWLSVQCVWNSIHNILIAWSFRTDIKATKRTGVRLITLNKFSSYWSNVHTTFIYTSHIIHPLFSFTYTTQPIYIRHHIHQDHEKTIPFNFKFSSLYVLYFVLKMVKSSLNLINCFFMSSIRTLSKFSQPHMM